MKAFLVALCAVLVSCTSTGPRSATHTPSPAPESPAPSTAPRDPVIAAAGDIACAPLERARARECAQEATARLIQAAHAAAVLTLGDNQYDLGTITGYRLSYDRSWGRFKDITRPVPGNHEYGSKKAAGYYTYFGPAAGKRTQGYYSFDVGTWHFIALNSNCYAVGGCKKGSPQETWLRADLRAHPATCTLAYWHHPRFSSGVHGDADGLADFWTALYDGGADVILAGHDHDYERFAPQTPSGGANATKGIREFVVGTGGRSHYATLFKHPNSEVRNSRTFGVILLTLHAASYDWHFRPVAGATFSDAGTGRCH
ncbi:MAG: metallophosphoesterase [Actinomycetota bacterium]|nr:metallophosphoesterase [Actinomycetota bacterium]